MFVHFKFPNSRNVLHSPVSSVLLHLFLCLIKALGPQAHIREPGGSLSVTHEIRMLGYEKQGRDH